MAKYELNLQDYLRILRKRKGIIISFVVASFFFSFFYTSFSKPSYRTSSTIKILQRETTAGLLTELLVWNPGDIMATAASTITSYNIMKGVARKMGLVSEKAPEFQVEGTIAALQGEVKAERVGQTNLIRITVTSPTRDRALHIARYTAEAFIEDNLETKNRQSTSVRQFVEEQLQRYRKTLAENEQELIRYKETLPLDERQVSLENLYSSKDDPVIAGLETQLADKRLKLSLMLQDLTEEHPDVIAIKSEIAFIEKQLEEARTKFADRIKGLPEKQIQYAQILRNLEINKTLFTKFRDRLEEVKITQAQAVEDVTIVDPPLEPYPIGPNRRKSIFLGVLLGTMLGLVLAFLRETLDTSIGTIEDVEEYIKLPVLGVIPHIEVEQPAAGMVETGIKKWRDKIRQLTGGLEEDIRSTRQRITFTTQQKGLIAEAYRILQTNLQFTALDKNLKALVFTSVAAGEGKTLTAINSAICMAQMGKKVLLVDADYRRPSIHKVLGISRENGLSEVIMEKYTLQESLKNITDIILGDLGSRDIVKFPGVENLNVLTCGTIPLNPPSLLSSEKMTSIIEEMKQLFDVVLFDSAPVLPVTDTLILSGKTQMVILVYQTGRAARGALKRAKEQLVNVGAHVGGVVLNNIAASEMRPAASYYYYERES